MHIIFTRSIWIPSYYTRCSPNLTVFHWSILVNVCMQISLVPPYWIYDFKLYVKISPFVCDASFFFFFFLLIPLELLVVVESFLQFFMMNQLEFLTVCYLFVSFSMISIIMPYTTIEVEGAFVSWSGMWFHLAMGSQTKVVASHTSIWQHLTQLQAMPWKTRGLPSPSVNTLLGLVGARIPKTLLVLKSHSLERLLAFSCHLIPLSFFHI